MHYAIVKFLLTSANHLSLNKNSNIYAIYCTCIIVRRIKKRTIMRANTRTSVAHRYQFPEILSLPFGFASSMCIQKKKTRNPLPPKKYAAAISQQFTLSFFQIYAFIFFRAFSIYHSFVLGMFSLKKKNFNICIYKTLINRNGAATAATI